MSVYIPTVSHSAWSLQGARGTFILNVLFFVYCRLYSFLESTTFHLPPPEAQPPILDKCITFESKHVFSNGGKLN